MVASRLKNTRISKRRIELSLSPQKPLHHPLALRRGGGSMLVEHCREGPFAQGDWGSVRLLLNIMMKHQYCFGLIFDEAMRNLDMRV